ncbi:fibronectin type III domain-containing protein [Chryseobacterium sp. MYb264]|uniref:fibronectin type III domain-containing protein n=1 Tax=Chryseobacterium sp. MYb264 TaxID=2745153 RepID=UPI002E16012B|nr:fibronectin type III domain-containing protein [Chryseobacterium sp. MYb264]
MKMYFQRYKKNQQRWASYYSKLITLLLLTAYSVLPTAKAQQYPVKLVPVVIPPYSLKIGDYSTSSDNKLQLQVLMTDLLEPQHQTGIKFSLEAGLNAVPLARSNDFIVGMNPFMLYPGNSITLTNVDLRSLFELQNLSGINALQYSKPLSDGVYQFCFQAYDFYTKNNLSSKTCATVFLVQYDPPMLTLPQNAEKVQALSPYGGGPGVVFQWMPRQIAPNTKYIFTLKELWDQGQSPISGFLSSPALWTEETYAPTLYYGIDKTQLMPGKRYAWQVQAKSGNPVLGANPTDDNGVYKNNGLSEIFYFDYVENCAVPTLLMAKNVGRGRVELQWSIAGQPAGLYNVQYRKKGSTADWVTQQSYQASAIITGLEDKTEYEYRIGSVCGNVQTFNNNNPFENGNSGGNAYSYSSVQYFTTDADDKDNNYQCGIMPAIDIANKTPLNTQLGNNEVFTAGDFPVTVLSAQGSGVYTGTGYIEVPYLANTKLKVTFNNIKLNTDKKLIEGVVETTYDPTESNVYDGGIFDMLDQAVRDSEIRTNEAINQTFFYQNSFDVVMNNQTVINNIITPYITNLTNLGLINTSLKDQILAEQQKQKDILNGLDCPKKEGSKDEEDKGKNKEENKEQTNKPKGSDDDVRIIETECDKKLKDYQQSQIKLLALMKQAQQQAADKITSGQAFPPKYTDIGSAEPPKPITASRLREIQSHCEDGALGYWEAKGFVKVENNGNPFYYCRLGDEVFYHYKQPGDTYGYENYWFVDGNWYMEGTTQQCAGEAFNCFVVYDAVSKKYVLANLETGESSGEQAADFITWLFVRDMPLMIVGGSSGSIYEILVNGLGDPLISALNATDKITDEEALAAQVTLALSGNVKHLTPENLSKIKTVLTAKFKTITKRSGKNAKVIAEELKEEIVEIVGKSSEIDVSKLKLRNIMEGADDWVMVFYDDVNLGDVILSNGVTLELDIVVPKALQGKGILKEIFNQAIQKFNPLEIKSTWKYDPVKYKEFGGLSDNLKVFLEKESNLGEVGAAFETPSGKVAKYFGFTNATVKKSADGKIVEVYFIK